MKTIYLSNEYGVEVASSARDGAWVCLCDPSSAELAEVSLAYGIELDDLSAALDPDERSRVSAEDGYVLIIVDIPVHEPREGKDWFVTLPLGIIVTDDVVVTVCRRDTELLREFSDGKVKGFATNMRSRFVFQMLRGISVLYQADLQEIDKRSHLVEERLHSSTKNSELIELLQLEKSIVYFTTSLRGNARVLDKLTRSDIIKKYPDDEELLEDTVEENSQAIEVAGIYGSILSGMMDAFASVISNNQNVIMKTLALVTIVMSIPTMIFSAYGMNVAASGMPFSASSWGFWIIIIISFAISALATLFFVIKKWF
jgi:magnesium transporter